MIVLNEVGLLKGIFAIIFLITVPPSKMAFASVQLTNNQYCIFDLYAKWEQKAAFAETVCSTGFVFKSGNRYAEANMTHSNLDLAQKVLTGQGYVRLQSFETALKLNDGQVLAIFKKTGTSNSKEVCFVSSKKSVLLGCSAGTVLSGDSSLKSLSEELLSRGFIQTGMISKMNLSQDEIAIFER